jgi:hypothetical protein
VILKPKDRPKRKYEAVRVYPDGREVCQQSHIAGKREYRRRIYVMLERQGNRCGLMITPDCIRRGGNMAGWTPTFEHVDGRGMGGSHRDDRIEKDGKPYNLAACYACNNEKGSRRL